MREAAVIVSAGPPFGTTGARLVRCWPFQDLLEQGHPMNLNLNLTAEAQAFRAALQGFQQGKLPARFMTTGAA